MPVTINGTTGIATPDGSASVPPYTGSSGATNGLFFPSATSMALASNGTVALTIDSSQNVGIGISSPGSKLDVNGNVRSKTSTGGVLNMDSTTAGTSNTIGSYANNGAAFADLNYSGNQHIWLGGGSERMRIDSSGNVGIGITPGYKLNVGVSNPTGGVAQLNQNVATTGQNGVLTAFDVYNVGVSAFGIPSGASNALAFYVGGSIGSLTERARIDSSGNLLVGTTGATGKITTYNTFGYAIQSSASAQADYLNYGATGSLANATGSAYYWRRNYDNVIQFQFDGAGNAAKASGAGTWNAYSDERLKTNIKKISDGLNNILSLNPVSFDYKIPEAHGNKKSDKGFLAGEFEKTYPNSVVCSNSMITDAEKEFVSEEDPAKLLGFNAEFYADLVSAIQELAAEVEALKKKVA